MTLRSRSATQRDPLAGRRRARCPTLFCVFLLGVAGCAAPEVERPGAAAGASAPVAASAAEAPLGTHVRIAGETVEGRPLEVRMLGTGSDVVLILATIHGDEAAGTPLLERLEAHLLAHPAELRGRTVVLVPVANPDGRTAEKRTNARGVDLNRNFPASNFARSGRHGAKALSEPESRALHRLILDCDPARVVSLHQPVSCIDWDGPAADLARAMAETCGLPARRIGSLPGSLGSWVGLELGRPIITFELPRNADLLSPGQLWGRYGAALLVAVRGVDASIPAPGS